jgi:cyclopropane fatty-acyl-phospholipid synthase-like methyltransferase
MADHYHLKAGDKVLDIGCGKGFLLFDFTKVVPGIEVTGIDISEYAIDNSKEEVERSTSGV